MSEVADTVDDAVDALSATPTSDEVFYGTIGFSAREIASTAVSLALSGGGGGSSLYPVIAAKQVYVASTGVAATDTAAIMAAHDGFGANGGTIVLDAGPYVFTGDGVNFTKSIHLLGTGPSGAPPAHESYLTIGSKIQCASATASAILVNADGCTFEKLYIQNTNGSAPSAGAGIKCVTRGKNFRIIDCCISEFWINLDVLSGYYWMLDRCVLQNPVACCVRIANALGADSGDMTLTNSLFTPGPYTDAVNSAAIIWHEGGGFRLTNCKINNNSIVGSNNFNTGVYFATNDGVGTYDLFVCNNSIENINYGIILDQNGTTGTVSGIVISTNEIASGTPILINPATPGAFDNISIVGNVYATGFDLNITNATNVRLHGQSHATVGRPPASVMAAGSWYYDTTLDKPGFADGAGNWKDAAGSTI